MGAPSSVALGGEERPGDRAAETAMLSPTMSSMQNLALGFIKGYFASWGVSPTLGEIGAALKTSRKRAHELRKALVAKGFIKHAAGQTRGIQLIDRTEELSEKDVLARLLAEGWTIGAGSRIVYPPGEAEGVTENGLFLLPLLDHLPAADQTGMGIDGGTERPRAAGNRRGGVEPGEGEAGG